ALSKEHAVIEIVNAENHLIYDLGSRNKTRLGKMILQPEVRYQLEDGAKLHLADVYAIYWRLPNGPEINDDSGSETGSESMLNVNNSVDGRKRKCIPLADKNSGSGFIAENSG
ncbi:hypothetical protein L9F63_013169, partial [Diploptera punctata]